MEGGEGHLLEQPDVLTPRAVRFLRDHAARGTFQRVLADEQSAAAEAAARFGLQIEDVASAVSRLQDRFGIQYRSNSWSFDEVIKFAPVLDFDDDDEEPMLSLIEHTVAHPFGVWVNLEGVVYFMFPEVNGAEYVRAFDRIEDLIESDALHAECANWSRVSTGGLDSLAEIQVRARELDRIEEGSGITESWWAGDEFRVYIWQTWAKIFGRDELSKWAVWAYSPRGREMAQKFLSGS